MKRLVITTIVCLLLLVMTTVQPSSASVSNSGYVELNETAQFNNVVIFIRFADEPTYQAPYDLSYYDNMFNGLDTISVRDYYLEVSYGDLTIDSYLVADTNVIFYTDTYNRSYFVPYDVDTNPNGYLDYERDDREHQLLKRAIDFVETNDLVPDELDLDVNDDGDIDSITFMISGETTDWQDILWPHKWQLHTFYNWSLGDYEDDAPMINGSYAYTYTFELLGNSTDFDYAVDVPVIAHETFHLLSAPDLYHYYRYDWIDPVGDWGIMDSITDIPSHMLGYMKLQYGAWIPAATEITTDGTYTIAPIQTSRDNLYVIDTGYDNEYLYLEYRDQSGVYESNTPGSGLIVYRVDTDYLDEGNELGYYLDDGTTPANEVFVFRPGIIDTLAPITFAAEDDDTVDEDGIPELGGLSNLGAYDAIGIGTDIPLFHSDGSLMEISITNITEANGDVTFDITFDAPRTDLVSDYTFNNINNVQLVDAMGTFYQAQFVNVAPTDTVYYTVDGTTPTTEDTLYTGPFEITSSTNHIQAIMVDPLGETLQSWEHTFAFVTNLESGHNPYDDLAQVYFYLNFQHLTEYTISFNQFSRFADESDRFFVYHDDTITTYTESMMQHDSINGFDQGVLMEFYSDEDDNNEYGFTGTIDVLQIFNGLSFELIGDPVIELDLFGSYSELGITLLGEGEADAYVTITDDINTDHPGTYTVTYQIYDGEDDLVGTVTRDVIVSDVTAPTIQLNGADTLTLEVFDSYDELSATVTDDYQLMGEVIITGEVDTTLLGTYTLYYSVFDSSGNRSEIVERTIHIVDTTAPELTLAPGIDTIYLNETWEDGFVLATDNYDTELSIEILQNAVNTTIPGTYQVMYRAVDSTGNYTFMYRMVTVLLPEVDHVVVCEAGQTTYTIGESFVPIPCVADGVTMSPSDAPTTLNQAGTYSITYVANVNGIPVEHTSYIFVIDEPLVLYLEPSISRKRRDVR